MKAVCPAFSADGWPGKPNEFSGMTTHCVRKLLPWAAALIVRLSVASSATGADFLPPDAPTLKPYLQF